MILLESKYDCKEIIELSKVEYNKNNYIEAFNILKNNIDNITPNSSYYFYLGFYSALLSNHREAIFFNKKAIEYDSNNKSAINNLACSYVSIGRYDIALKYLKYLKSQSPKDKKIDKLVSYILKLKKNKEKSNT